MNRTVTVISASGKRDQRVSGDGKDQDEDGLNRVHQCRSEDHANRLDIAVEATHQIAGVQAGMEGAVEILEVSEHVVSEPLLDAAAGADHRLSRPEGGDSSHQNDPQHRHGDGKDQVDSNSSLESVDGKPDEAWNCHLTQTAQDDQAGTDQQDRSFLDDQWQQEAESFEGNHLLSWYCGSVATAAWVV